MNTYKIENERIYFKTAYSAEFISDVKDIMGRRWEPETREWSCPIKFTTSKQITTLISKYDIKETVYDAGSTQINTNIPETIETAVERRKTTLNQEINSLQNPLLIKPRDYQLNGIAYNLLTKRALNGSEMGTGKTFTSIFTIEIGNLFPCVVIVPASIKYNWKMQWERVNPKRTVSVIEGTEKDFTTDVIILTYDGVGKREVIDDKEKVFFKHEEFNTLKIKSIICDESQALKNGKAIRTKAVKKLSKGVEHVFMLTGTPVMNRPNEIIAPLGILGQFESLFGNWRNFVYRYCGATETRFGTDISGATNTKELHEKLREACYFRVEKRDVLKDLPPIQETVYQVEISNRKQYDKAQVDLISYLKDNYGELKANSALYAEQLVMISTLSKLSVEGKVEGICEWLDNFLESSEDKIIVFGVHTEPLKQLASKYKGDIIIGEVSTKKRQEIIDSFQTNKKRLLFMNILTGSVGIDGLQNVCSDELFIELPYRYADIQQAISRIERSGQKNSIGINFLLGKGTIDEARWALLLKKKKVTDAVNVGLDVESQKYMDELIKMML